MERAGNAVDRALAWLAPRYGAKRLAARLAIQYLDGLAYDAASRGPRLAGWRAEGTSANAEVDAGLHTTRARARDLVRNHSYAAKAVGILQRQIVGAGIVVKIGTREDAAAQRLRERWRAWGETTACDACDQLNFFGLQSQAMRCIAESGEVLVRRRWRKPEDDLPLPFQLQLIEPDHLDTLKTEEVEGGNRIIQGVEFDRIGRRVAYWLFPEHPGDITTWRSVQSKRIPAADILHIYRVDRIGQVRGIPWGAAAFVELRDYSEVKDARLVREKIAACLVAFITGSADIIPPKDASGRAAQEKLVPGTIRRLGPAETVTFSQPGGVEGFKEFAEITKESIAAGYEVPYELLTGDYSRFNYSSSRQSRTDFGISLDDWQWNLVIPQFCHKVWSWVLDGAVLDRVIDRAVEVLWVPPRRALIDPLKETMAEERQIRNGFKTIGQSIREAGGDPDEVWEERAAELTKLREHGIPTESDGASRGGSAVTGEA